MTPHHAYPDVSYADLRAELQREIAHRRDTLPRLVDKGQILKAIADREIDVFAIMLEDLARWQQASTRPGPPAIAAHAYTWHERRRAISDALDARARNWPARIAKGQITQADADLWTRRLTCMRALYELGRDWQPRNGARCHFAALRPTPEEEEAREEWFAIETEIAARDGLAQEQLAL